MHIDCIVLYYICSEQKKRAMINRHYDTFYIAGFTYWDGLEVFNNLKVGAKLTLEAEPTNGYDPSAVKILFKGTMLGYIPRGQNEDISKFLQLGYVDLFSARISRVNSEEHMEQQVAVTVKIRRKY